MSQNNNERLFVFLTTWEMVGGSSQNSFPSVVTPIHLPFQKKKEENKGEMEFIFINS